VYADTWGSPVSHVLHEGVISRHIMLTVPAMFRRTFEQNAAVVLSAFMRCEAQCCDAFSRIIQGTPLQGGSLTVLHTHGRHGPSHPHLHGLATRGGYDAHTDRWEHLQYLPYALLRRMGQWHLLTMLRQTLKTEAVAEWVETWLRTDPNGLVTTVQKGALPAQAHRVARYVATYVVRPPIAVRRIARYEGERVTSHDRSHRTDRLEHDTVPVQTWLGRLVQHVLPKGCKRIRYDGGQATTTCAQVKAVMQAALAQVEGVGKGAVKIIARLTDRQRYEQSTGRDPFRCPHCGGEMAVWRIWHPKMASSMTRGKSSNAAPIPPARHEPAPAVREMGLKSAQRALCA
jgi:hypothetical protein